MKYLYNIKTLFMDKKTAGFRRTGGVFEGDGNDSASVPCAYIPCFKTGALHGF